jgi:hypothetical protein
MAITVPTRLPVYYQDHDDQDVWSPYLVSMDSVQLSSKLVVALAQDETAGYVLIDIHVDGERGSAAPEGRVAAAAPHDSIPNTARGRTLLLAESRGSRQDFFPKFREVVGGLKREIETHRWIPIVRRKSFAYTFARNRCLHSSWCLQCWTVLHPSMIDPWLDQF